MKIFLVRHGETTGDIEDRYGGDYEDHLTDLGKSQAKVTAKKLKAKNIEIIFTSPRIRAQEAAKIIGNELDVPTETMPRLAERSYAGTLTGMVKREAQEKYPELVDLIGDYRNTLPGAETYAAFWSRVKSVIDEIRTKEQEVVAVVTHGGVIRAIFREEFGHSEIKLALDASIELDWDGKELKLGQVEGASW